MAEIDTPAVEQLAVFKNHDLGKGPMDIEADGTHNRLASNRCNDRQPAEQHDTY